MSLLFGIMSTEESTVNTTANAALMEGAREVTQKYTEEAWDAAEKKLSEFDTNVLKMLIAAGTGETGSFGEQQLKVMGDDLYMLVRNLVSIEEKGNKIALVDESTHSTSENNPSGKNGKKQKKGAKKNAPKMKKIDMMRLENAKETVMNNIKDVTKTFSVKSLTPHSAFRSDILEIRAIGLMYCLWFICNNYEKYSQSGSESKHYPFVLSVIVAAERFLKSCKDYSGTNMIIPGSKIVVSNTLIEDMTALHTKSKEKYPYDGFTIYNHAPELLIYSEYDKCIPSKGISPRKNQKEVIDFVKKNFDTGFLLSYKAMISSGKTTCSIALIKCMEKKLQDKKIQDKYGHLQFIFCCNLASVKCQVAQICYNSNVPFAMAHVDKDGTTKIINNFNCVSDSARVCIIGSPDAVSQILTDHSKGDPKNKYVLFHDEPTIGADMKGSDSLKDNVTVMSNLPRWSILSSATMPDIEILEPFTTKFTEDNPGSVMGTVYSDEIQIGCDVITLNMDPVIPHLGCKTGNALRGIINTIKKNPFLGRIYTHNVAQTIWTECSKLDIPKIPNIPEIFKDVENLSADNVRKYVMQMLTIVADQSDDIVTDICSSPIFIDGINTNNESSNDNSDSDSDSDDGFAWETEEVKPDSGAVDYCKLGTTQAHRFLHMNLVATLDPLTFAINNFKDLLDSLKNHEEYPVNSAKNILSKYKKDMDNFNAQMARLEKDVENEDELSKQIEELRSNKPQIKFPKCGQINTIHHIHEYAPSSLKTINKRFISQGLTIEDIPYETFSVPDNILLLLFCGVGIYSPGNRMLDQNYINTVLSLAESGNLAYLIADSSICYGTNYPINRVFVVEDFSNSHSIYTLFQLMGRAGRVGRSWKAEAYVHDSCARSILEYSNDPDKYDTEGDNMVSTFNKIKNDHEAAILAEITKMQDELTRLEEKAKQEEKAKLLAKQKAEEERMKLVRVGDVFDSPVNSKNAWKGTSWRKDHSNESDNKKQKNTSKWNRKDNSGDSNSDNSSRSGDKNEGKKKKHYNASNGTKRTKNDSENKKYVPPYLRKKSDDDKKSTGGSMSWRKR